MEINTSESSSDLEFSSVTTESLDSSSSEDIFDEELPKPQPGQIKNLQNTPELILQDLGQQEQIGVDSDDEMDSAVHFSLYNSYFEDV